MARPRHIPKAEALKRLLPAFRWFQNNIYDAIEVGQTQAVAKRLAVAEHKANRSGMCFAIEPLNDPYDDPGIVALAFKPSDCTTMGDPKPTARSVGTWSVNAPDTDDAAIRYAKAAAAAEYFGDKPLRRTR